MNRLLLPLFFVGMLAGAQEGFTWNPDAPEFIPSKSFSIEDMASATCGEKKEDCIEGRSNFKKSSPVKKGRRVRAKSTSELSGIRVIEYLGEGFLQILFSDQYELGNGDTQVNLARAIALKDPFIFSKRSHNFFASVKIPPREAFLNNENSKECSTNQYYIRFGTRSWDEIATAYIAAREQQERSKFNNPIDPEDEDTSDPLTQEGAESFESLLDSAIS